MSDEQYNRRDDPAADDARFGRPTSGAAVLDRLRAIDDPAELLCRLEYTWPGGWGRKFRAWAIPTFITKVARVTSAAEREALIAAGARTFGATRASIRADLDGLERMASLPSRQSGA